MAIRLNIKTFELGNYKVVMSASLIAIQLFQKDDEGNFHPQDFRSTGDMEEARKFYSELICKAKEFHKLEERSP